MKENLQKGSASIAFSHPVYFRSAASVVGEKEGEGPLKDYFDVISDDPMFGTDPWEAAESTMQQQAASLAVTKAGLKTSDIRMVFAGDLLAQTVASSFGIAELGIPFYGLYGACSTMGESLSLGSMAKISSAQPPVISQLPKKNSVFLSDTEINALCLQPGQLPEVQPASSVPLLHVEKPLPKASLFCRIKAVPQSQVLLPEESLILDFVIP